LYTKEDEHEEVHEEVHEGVHEEVPTDENVDAYNNQENVDIPQ